MRFFIALIIFNCACLNLQAQVFNSPFTYSVSKPATVSSKTPVLILMHGYGSDERDLLQLAKTLAPEFLCFSLRAPFTRPDRGYSWFQLQILANHERKYQYSEAKESAEKILSFISRACRAYGADSSKVFLLGFSQGAIMSYEIALRAPSKIKGVIALSGGVMPESKTLATPKNEISKVSFFIGHGTSDEIISIADAVHAEEFLKSKKALKVTFKKYNMGHSISQEELSDIRLWLNLVK